MNLTLLSYCIYFPISGFITFRIGWLFYTNGRGYLTQLFQGNLHFAQRINKLLRLGYYLLNIGFVCFYIITWSPVLNIQELLQQLSHAIGQILLLLGVMHYFNLFWLQFLTAKQLKQ